MRAPSRLASGTYVTQLSYARPRAQESILVSGPALALSASPLSVCLSVCERVGLISPLEFIGLFSEVNFVSYLSVSCCFCVCTILFDGNKKRVACSRAVKIAHTKRIFKRYL